MELEELNKKYNNLLKKEIDLKLKLYGTVKEIDELTDQAVKEGYNLSLDTGKWIKECGTGRCPKLYDRMKETGC